MAIDDLTPESDHEHDAILQEIIAQPDRAAAIVAFAWLDDRLKGAIAGHFYNRTHKGENIQNQLFKGSGPLATFSARTKLAFLLGLFGPQTYDDLRRLATIRNEFAHKRLVRTFDTQRIKSLCGALTTTTPGPPLPIPESRKFSPIFNETRLRYIEVIMYLSGAFLTFSRFSRPPHDRSDVLP